MIERTTKEEIREIFDAFDTIAEDESELKKHKFLELIEEVKALKIDDVMGHIEASNVVDERHNERSQNIQERYRHIAGGTLGRLDIKNLKNASIDYIEDQREDENAAKRVGRYGLALVYVNQVGVVDNKSSSIAFSPDYVISAASNTEPVKYRLVKFKQDKDDPTKRWMSLTDRRTLEQIGAEDLDNSDVVSRIKIDTYKADEATGEIVAKYGMTTRRTINRETGKVESTLIESSGRQISFIPDSDTYRLVEDEKSGTKFVEIFSPANAQNLDSVLNSDSDSYLDRKKKSESGRVTLQATGANMPNIIESFEHPDHANPVPISVGKTQ